MFQFKPAHLAILWCGLPALSLAFSTQAQAQASELEPSSQWMVDFGPQKCRLARIFGEGENKHLLAFDQFNPSGGFGLTVAGPGFKRFQSRINTKLQFSETSEPKEGKPFKGDSGTYGPAMIYSSTSLLEDSQTKAAKNVALPQLELTSAAEAQFVSVTQRGKKIIFKTGPLAKAFAVMNTCTQDMVKDWGLDVERHLSAIRSPEFTNVSAIAKKIQQRYPIAAINRGEQAIIRMRVIVAADGSIEQCALLEATKTKKLQSKACEPVIKHGKFAPALDADGQPFRSYYTTLITYRMGR